MDESINVENKKQKHQKPPLSFVRIAGEILAGAAFWIVPLLVIYGTDMIFNGKGDNTDSGTQLLGLGILVMFFLVFPPLAGLVRAVGVYLVGSIGKQTGSFVLTFLVGGFLDVLCMFVMFFIIPVLGSDLIEEGGTIFVSRLVVIVLFVPPIFAILAFNLTRRYKEPHSS
jgi:hypothetical protein